MSDERAMDARLCVFHDALCMYCALQSRSTCYKTCQGSFQSCGKCCTGLAQGNHGLQSKVTTAASALSCKCFLKIADIVSNIPASCCASWYWSFTVVFESTIKTIDYCMLKHYRIS